MTLCNFVRQEQELGFLLFELYYADSNVLQLRTLLEHHQTLAQKEKAEKERKKYANRRTRLMYAVSRTGLEHCLRTELY